MPEETRSFAPRLLSLEERKHAFENAHGYVLKKWKWIPRVNVEGRADEVDLTGVYLTADGRWIIRVRATEDNGGELAFYEVDAFTAFAATNALCVIKGGRAFAKYRYAKAKARRNRKNGSGQRPRGRPINPKIQAQIEQALAEDLKPAVACSKFGASPRTWATRLSRARRKREGE
jgi:hypothetical protein